VEAHFLFLPVDGPKKDQESPPKPSRKWVETFKEMTQNLQGNGSKRPRKIHPDGILKSDYIYKYKKIKNPHKYLN
jgi:hypothetical protein